VSPAHANARVGSRAILPDVPRHGSPIFPAGQPHVPGPRLRTPLPRVGRPLPWLPPNVDSDPRQNRGPYSGHRASFLLASWRIWCLWVSLAWVAGCGLCLVCCCGSLRAGVLGHLLALKHEYAHASELLERTLAPLREEGAGSPDLSVYATC
jgi:hypothetical protein